MTKKEQFKKFILKSKRYHKRSLLYRSGYLKIGWRLAIFALKKRWIIPVNSDLVYSRRHGNKYYVNIDEFPDMSHLAPPKILTGWGNGEMYSYYAGSTVTSTQSPYGNWRYLWNGSMLRTNEDD